METIREGEGSSEMEGTAIESNACFLDNAILFHVIKDVLGFVLYMHQQIPSILQDMSLEFDTLQAECKELETAIAQADLKASSRRQQLGRMREVKRGIRRLEKLMKTISSLESALQLIISENPDVEEAILILGASPIRPLCVYELSFLRGNAVPSGDEGDFVKSRAAQGLSKKAVRKLISMGAGSAAYPGPLKLFLLVKAPSSFNMPLHFLPKRDFRYNKKVLPFRLRLKCRRYTSQTSYSTKLRDSAINDLIWYGRFNVANIGSCTTNLYMLKSLIYPVVQNNLAHIHCI